MVQRSTSNGLGNEIISSEHVKAELFVWLYSFHSYNYDVQFLITSAGAKLWFWTRSYLSVVSNSVRNICHLCFHSYKLSVMKSVWSLLKFFSINLLLGRPCRLDHTPQFLSGRHDRGTHSEVESQSWRYFSKKEFLGWKINIVHCVLVTQLLKNTVNKTSCSIKSYIVNFKYYSCDNLFRGRAK